MNVEDFEIIREVAKRNHCVIEVMEDKIILYAPVKINSDDYKNDLVGNDYFGAKQYWIDEWDKGTIKNLSELKKIANKFKEHEIMKKPKMNMKKMKNEKPKGKMEVIIKIGKKPKGKNK